MDQGEDRNWLINQIQYYIEKIIDARREDVTDLENYAKDYTDKLTRERNIIISVIGFLVASIFPIMLKFPGEEILLIFASVISISIGGLLFVVISISKNKILNAISIIRAGYYMPFTRLIFVRDNFVGSTIFQDIKKEINQENLQNFYIYLQVVGASKIEAIHELTRVANRRISLLTLDNIYERGSATEEYLKRQAYQILVSNKNRLISDPLVTFLDNAVVTSLGSKTIFELYAETSNSKQLSRFKSKIDIILSIPDDWEVTRDNYSHLKRIGSFCLRHKYYKLNELQIIKNKTLSQIQSYVDSIKQDLEGDDSIQLKEMTEISIASNIPAYRFTYESKFKSLVSMITEIYFKVLQDMYTIKYESVRSSEYSKLLPEVEQIIKSVQIKG